MRLNVAEKEEGDDENVNFDSTGEGFDSGHSS